MDTNTEQTENKGVELSTEVVDTNAAVETATDTGKEGAGSGDTGEKVAKEAPAAYKPDYKLKVYDEEKELDDPFLKNLIKDADSEKKVKEIAQKYLGFDTVKGRHERVKEDYQKYQTDTKPIVEVYNQYQKHAQKGDLDGIFELLKIPTDAIFKYAVQKAEEAQLPREQQMYMEQQRQVQRQRDYLEGQNQTLQEMQHQQLSQFRNQELHWVMSRPDVSGVAQAFDSKNGPGAFRQLVIDKGLAHHAATQGKEDLSAEQSVSAVLKMLGHFVTPTALTPTPGVAAANLIQQNGAPPIIPNVTGGNASPVKKQVRSIADLKKKGEEVRMRT